MNIPFCLEPVHFGRPNSYHTNTKWNRRKKESKPWSWTCFWAHRLCNRSGSRSTNPRASRCWSPTWSFSKWVKNVAAAGTQSRSQERRQRLWGKGGGTGLYLTSRIKKWQKQTTKRKWDQVQWNWSPLGPSPPERKGASGIAGGGEVKGGTRSGKIGKA